MKKLLYFACILCASLTFVSCEKSYQTGIVTVFGNVVDADTGDPIPVAEIHISSGSNYNVTDVSTVTGSDGTFEIDVTLPAGERETFPLSISIEKKGYYSIDYSSLTLSRDMVGKRVQKSFTLESRY